MTRDGRRAFSRMFWVPGRVGSNALRRVSMRSAKSCRMPQRTPAEALEISSRHRRGHSTHQGEAAGGRVVAAASAVRGGVERGEQGRTVLRSPQERAGRAQSGGTLSFLRAFREPCFRHPAEEYGIIRADLERAGTPIGPNDLLIAALARSRDLTLVSLNQREFGRVAGLRLATFDT